MSFANPTSIQVGTWGTFNGVRYRVAGRVVLGADVDGQRYYWNEFHLVAENGEEATLVHEEGEHGVEWRMFVLFTPEFPMSAEAAARQRVGDRLNLEGTDVRITLVDESRVYHIEGNAPEGVELGDVANYFNARLGKDMIVVSWTGDDVEYYRGRDLTSGLVAAAFGRSEAGFGNFVDPFRGGSSSADISDAVSPRMLQIVVAVLLITMVFVGATTCRSSRRPAPASKVRAPDAPLTVGSKGEFDGKSWQIRAHALLEIAQVGRLFERHEYQLTDEEGNRALLVCGMLPGADDWAWLTPLDPLNPPTPAEAGALRAGETVTIDGWVGPITGLFQATTRQASPEGTGIQDGGVQFGFTAQSGSSLLQARWNMTSIMFHRGKLLKANAVKAAFGKN